MLKRLLSKTILYYCGGSKATEKTTKEVAKLWCKLGHLSIRQHRSEKSAEMFRKQLKEVREQINRLSTRITALERKK